ncbi:alpha/beta fold hydrolase [Planomicrobium sp. CPCC 101110]|uniref:alpha/beta fold hydrolase n=1 Tax=Planomicrobium sp. CPCC 101110 TaxID=2599619 RepID=UPI0011B4F2E3|nr:alpha/beta hydrolase [Planomicrobium sp. CPCC 101110]TWT28225.1 lysophospholipase [Planomicrobium sp. CPCC 101110]
MKVTKGFLEASDGHEIYYELYEAENPTAHVHIVHGMAEHIGRYEEFSKFLADNGYSVSGHDHRGHGRTAQRNGMQGFFADERGFERVVEDVEEVISAVQQKTGGLPLVVFGHSMGSFVARRFMQLHSRILSRVVLSGTGGNPGAAGKLGLLFAASTAKRTGKTETSKVLGKLTFGSFNKAFKKEESSFAWLSSDADEVAKYENDPMCGFPSTNQFYVDLFTGLALIHTQAEVGKIRKNLPVLLISGAKDPVGGNGKGIFSSAEQYAKAGLKDVTVFLAEEGRHELLNERNKEMHYQTILGWLKKYD